MRQGDTLQFEATGEVTLNRNGSMRAQPGGAPGNQLDGNAPLRNVPIGTLIGRIGSGGFAGQRTRQPFVIGDRASVTMPADGELFLGINDSSVTDNRGVFAVWMGLPGAEVGRGYANGQRRELEVTARQPWIATGIIVRQGEVLRFRTTGEVTLNYGGSLRARPGGVSINQIDPDAVLPNVPVGVLIGRIEASGRAGQRNTRPFVIGDQQNVSMPLDGELLLGINDSNFEDNNGAFTVRVDSR